MCEQNKKFGFVFGTFLAPIWSYHLEIARCKTTVNLLSYGIGIERWQLGGDVRTNFGTDGRTDGRTDRRTDGQTEKFNTISPPLHGG